MGYIENLYAQVRAEGYRGRAAASEVRRRSAPAAAARARRARTGSH